MKRIEPPEPWDDRSSVNPHMTIGQSIMHQVLNGSKEEIREKKLWKKRGINQIKINLELLDEDEKAGQ